MKTFQKTFMISAEISDVYVALTNPLTIELWSGYPATMDTQPGSEFSLWGGDIEGKVLEVKENKKIVQQWYFGEQKEASIATIILLQNYGSTSVTVEHTNIPDEDFANIAEGWRDYYIGAIQQFLNPNF